MQVQSQRGIFYLEQSQNELCKIFHHALQDFYRRNCAGNREDGQNHLLLAFYFFGVSSWSAPSTVDAVSKSGAVADDIVVSDVSSDFFFGVGLVTL